MILRSVLNLIFLVTGLGAFLWSVVGLPTGIVWMIIHLTKKGHKLNEKKWLIVTFGGLILLVIEFSLYAIYTFIRIMTGFYM